MKKTLIAISLLTAFGTAHAESSVSMYGTVNVAVTKKGSAGVKLVPAEYRYASHIGFSGKEDLGNGYAAVFKLEAEIEPDTGSGTYGSNNSFGFNRQSYVGMVTPFGAFRLGRSTTPFTNMWVGGNFAEGRGIGIFTGGLAGSGLRKTAPEVGGRWNNALFYDVKKGGLSAGLAVTTKGSQSLVPTRATALYAADGTTLLSPATTAVDNEGLAGTKAAYGGYARYEGKSGLWGYKVGAAYQADNGSSYTSSTNAKNAPAEAKDAYILGGGVSYDKLLFNIGYARAKIDNTTLSVASGAALRTGVSKTMFATMAYDFTPNDHVYVSYGRYKRSNVYQFNSAISGIGDIAGTQYTLGYEHRLSKRTLVYANARKVANITNSCSAKLGATALPSTSPYYAATCNKAIATVNSVLDTEKGYSYDIGISHSF